MVEFDSVVCWFLEDFMIEEGWREVGVGGGWDVIWVLGKVKLIDKSIMWYND